MEYLFNHPEILTNWKRHFYLRSITDAFGNVVSLQTQDDEDIGHKYPDERVRLMDEMIGMLSASGDNPKQQHINSNVCAVLSEILDKGSQLPDNVCLLLELGTERYVDQLVDLIYPEVITKS